MQPVDETAPRRPKLAWVRAILHVEVELAVPEEHVVAMPHRRVRKNYTAGLTELAASEAARSLSQDRLEIRLRIDGTEERVT